MKSTVARVPFIRKEAAPSPISLFEERSFFDGEHTLPYRIYVPADEPKKESYPLILFFHGAGERGNDNKAQFKNAIGQFFKDPASPVRNCIVVAPQCPEDQKWVHVSAWTETQYSTEKIAESWPLAATVRLIDELSKSYPIDPDQIYSTGLSMGAYATWDLLVRHTDLFAAAISVCGGADYRYASRIKDIPIFTFHGEMDSVVPPDGTERMVNTLTEIGAKELHCIYYTGGDHGIWENAFSTDALFDWLLSKRRSDRK